MNYGSFFLFSDAIISSTPSLLVANFIHIVSYLLLMMAMFSNKNTIYYFISGVSFIIAGLLMLIGIILYISIFKSEIGSKLKPKSSLQDEAIFTYRYGYSFVLYVIGILLVFCSGILNIFLYTGFNNNATTLQNISKGSPCFTYKNFSKVSSNSSSITSPMHRYVLRKDPNCNVHASQVIKNLNQLYTEPGPNVAPFEFPCVLTRSVSTLTSPCKKENKLINNMCGVGRSFLTSEKEKHSKNKKTTTSSSSSVNAKAKPKDIYYIENDGSDDLSNVFVIEPIESFHRRQRSMYESREHPKRISTNSLSDLDKIMATDYSNFDTQMYDDKCGTKSFNSRTLPRNFAQKNFSRACDDSRRISASGIFTPIE